MRNATFKPMVTIKTGQIVVLVDVSYLGCINTIKIIV